MSASSCVPVLDNVTMWSAVPKFDASDGALEAIPSQTVVAATATSNNPMMMDC